MLTTALAFSGGKDSWACLWLNKDRLHEIVVVWVDTGKNYPEMLETIKRAKAMCPNFTTISVDRAGQNAYHGLPADVVPVNWTRAGHLTTGSKPVTVQPYLQCCYENIAAPLNDFCKKNGITHIIAGQRNAEGHKSTSRHGDLVGGMTRLHPIEDWSEQQVFDFVAEHMPLPDHFQFKHSSMDCYDCTAYAAESKDRVSYTLAHHPGLYQEYATRKYALNSALSQSLEEILT